MNTQRSSTFVLILIVLIGFVGGYVLRSFGMGSSSLAVINPEEQSHFHKLAALKIDFSLLDSLVYRKLQQFGQFPIDASTPGKRDIFAP